jgi:dTDP-4-amino-4,6-dideoxygalactose transaminase
MTTTPAVIRQLSVPGVPFDHLGFAAWPYFESDEIQAVTSVLKSGKVNYWTGHEGRLFESEFAKYVGTNYAVCLANGTVALELALHALGIGPGDEIITTSRTFIASASCAVVRGAHPVFVDVDRDSQNITAETIHGAITPKTKAIIAVHLAGWPCDMDPILKLASEYGLKVVEDCAQAHGATYKGKPVGSFGHVAAFSFCQDKIITTAGEGGMLVTNDEELWSRAWSYKDHGKSYKGVFHRQHAPGYRWVHDSFGTNWRLTEMQSALGRVALRKLPSWVEVRRKHAAQLTECFRRLPALRTTEPPAEIEHSYYKYYVFLRPEFLREDWNRNRIMTEINAAGVPCASGSCSEIYLEGAFPPEMRPSRRLVVAEELGATSLMFLVHPTLTDTHIDMACSVVKEVMRCAVR